MAIIVEDDFEFADDLGFYAAKKSNEPAQAKQPEVAQEAPVVNNDEQPAQTQRPIVNQEQAQVKQPAEQPVPTKALAGLSSRDYNDTLNTLIAEAYGEGEEGMTAVAHVMNNRALKRGQSLGDVVRAKDQFTGYGAPGRAAVAAQQDPQIRAQAEKVLLSVLTGQAADTTGGADHYHANSVNPDWAQKMPKTVQIGEHAFYQDGGKPAPATQAFDQILTENNEPKGLERLVNRGNKPDSNRPAGSLYFVNPGQERIAPQFKSILTDTSAEMGRGLTITSGYRSPQHRVEARKKNPGQHSHGTAVDISMAGMDAGQRFNLVQSLMAKGVKRFGTYTNSPNMLHIDMKDQTGNGSPWFMHDTTNSRLSKAPDWFKAAQKSTSKREPIKKGGVINVDDDFKPMDGLGIYKDQNPFAVERAEVTTQDAPTTNADQEVEIDPDAAALEKQLYEMNSDGKGRYEAMTEDEYTAWKEKFDADQPGLIQDLARMAAGGVVKGVGHTVRGIGGLASIMAQNTITELINPIFGTDYKPSNPLRVPAEWIDEWGKDIQDGVSVATKEAIEGSTPDGDILKPSTWSLGKNPSAVGYMALGLDVFGSMAPVVTAAVVAGPVGGMAVGGAQGGGAAEAQAHEAIDEMAKTPGLLESQSSYYREQIAAGVEPEEALRLTKEAAGKYALILTAPVSGLGGAATSVIIHPASKIAAGSNIAGRVGARFGLGALEEGTQEAMESVATNAGINTGAGTNLDLTEGTFGDFVLGALAGGATGAAGGAFSKRADPVTSTMPAETAVDANGADTDVDAAPVKKGHLRKALDETASRIALEYVVNDPAFGNEPTGELHGQRVLISANQDNIPASMRRVITSDGVERVIGNGLLMPVDQAEKQGLSAASQAAPQAVPENAPAVGEVVDVRQDGLNIRAKIDSYQDGEAIVVDTDSGELYQVPLDAMQYDKKAADLLPVRDEVHMDELKPQAPIAAELKTEGVPPRDQQVSIADAFPTVEPGQNVIVDAPGMDRFTGRLESFVTDGGVNEAVVAGSDGMTVQVPVEHLYANKQTKAEIEAENLKRDPPVERDDVDPSNPLIRKFKDKAVELPDALHTRLYDLGRERQISKKLFRVSSLDADAIMPAEQRKLAEEFKISPEAVGSLAEDYRYRVERAGKEAKSKLPVKMHTVSQKRLKQWQSDLEKTQPDLATKLEPASLSEAERREVESVPNDTEKHWYDALPMSEREAVLKSAGVKRSAKPNFETHSKTIRDKIESARPAAPTSYDAPVAAAPIDVAAVEAATHPDNSKPEPTQAQKEAGNYSKGHVRLGGMDLAIENPAGSERKGVDASGKPWSVKMKSHYGYIKGTIGRDKDHIDIFVKPGTEMLDDNAPVFVVDQVDPKTGRFDEHKVLAGFENEADARAAYLENYTQGWKGLGDITQTTTADFKNWTKSGDTKAKFAPKWFGSQEKADAYIQKQGLSDTHAVVPNGKRFEIRPSDAPTIETFQQYAKTAPWDEVWSSEKSAIDDAIWKLASTVQGADERLSNAVKRGATNAELLAEASSIFGESGAGGNKYLVEARKAGIAVTLDKDEGKKKVTLRGKDLADRLRELFARSLDDQRAEFSSKTTGVPQKKAEINSDLVDKKATNSVSVASATELQKTTDAQNVEFAPNRKPADKTDLFSDNKLFTKDKVAAARERMRKKLDGSQLNSGLDPELMTDGMTIAGAYIEAGVRKFSDYAKAMVSDFGDGIKPYLLSFYEGIRYYPGLDTEGMSSTTEAQQQFKDLGKAESEDTGITADVLVKSDETKESREDGDASELGQSRQGSLERIPAPEVRSAESERNAGERAAEGSDSNSRGNGQPAGRGNASGRSVADGSRKTSDPSGRTDRDGVTSNDTAVTPAQQLADSFVITDADAIGSGGAKTKFKNNVQAIKLLRDLESEQRTATRAEQAVLAKWVGWGGLQTAFYREDGSVANGWDKEAAALKSLLTPEEYKAAQSSTRNAHYTDPGVVKAIWSIAQRLGFKGGRVLEPSVGAGNFLGLTPDNLRNSARFTGVELDHITGGIAKHLYPAANIQAPIGFQDVTIPNGYFDLAIGNPPFGSERLYDKNRRDLSNMSIHNYFFAKSVDALKPGGVLAMVITNSFMDATNAYTRDYIADRADLVAAIRLPNNAFLKNAGTEVTTDIVILQKRPEGTEKPKNPAWLSVGMFKDKEGRSVPLNQYFIDNPDMMLGEFGAYGTMYAPDQTALIAREGVDINTAIIEAVAKLPSDIMADVVTDVQPETITVAKDVGDAPVGSAFLDADGNVYVRAPDLVGETRASLIEFPNEKAKERVQGLVRIRDAFAKLRKAQISESASDATVENLRGQLNKFYDAFTKKHGFINQQANRLLFADDPTWSQLSALEDGFDKGISKTVSDRTGEAVRAPSARKAPIFTQRTQHPYKRPTSASTAKDALAISLSERGRLDIGEVAKLYGKPADKVVSELGDLIFKTPDGGYETADLYLSGNVKKKLAQAKAAAETDPSYRRNIEALQDVIPADIEPIDIDVKAGSPWVPAKYVAEFADYIKGVTGSRATYSAGNVKWEIAGSRANEAQEALWGTGAAKLDAILDAALNAKPITITYKTQDGVFTDQAATDAANAKVEKLKDEWKRWIWEDDARRTLLARIYNDVYNTNVATKYDGSHLALPGKVGDDVISLRPHQKDYVWRRLQSQTTLADHTVGAGKTFAEIAATMELRRTGQAKKPMLVVPNHLVGQWAADFVKLYPNANVLAATKKDFEKGNRKKLFARVATGDWDAVIVAHSSFGKIGVDPIFEAEFIQQQIEDIEKSMSELRQQTGKDSRNVKQLTKWRDNMQSKLERLMDSGAKDAGMTFEEMGIDSLSVDEAHEFKNLGFATSMTRVAGLGDPVGSQKASDLYVKIQSVKKRTGGRNIAFLTGTPISNTMAEMFTMQRYLDYEGLRASGVAHFDAWARVFGEVVTDWELSPSGQYKLNSRFAKFVNVPELLQRYKTFADVITNADIKAQLAAIGKKLPLPRVKGGKPTNVTVPRSLDQADFVGVGKEDEHGNIVFPEGSLVYRAENLPKRPEKGQDNMLKIMSDARKAALDMRLIEPTAPDVPGSKVHVAADNVKRLYDQWHQQKGTQLVFIDLSTPKKAVAKERAALMELMAKADDGDETAAEKLAAMSPDEFMSLDSSFSVYDDLKDKLIKRGIPEKEIAFIHDANTDAQKEELFSKVRAGTVRILFGSTPKMGAGTNVQNRLVGLHHLDAPWRPSDLEQRDGRGIRQGNELYNADPEGFEIEILRYATENTLDARQWQTIEAKARFIEQLRRGDSKDRSIEDVGGEASNAAEMKAAASGNPKILEEMDLRQKLKKLDNAYSEHKRSQHRIEADIKRLGEERSDLTYGMAAAVSDAKAAAKTVEAGHIGIIRGHKLEKAKEIGEAIISAGQEMLQDSVKSKPIGKYGEFALKLEHKHTAKFNLVAEAENSYQVEIADIDDTDARGLTQRLANTISRLVDVPEANQERISKIDQTVPALEKQLGAWPEYDRLVETKAKHTALIDELRPKKAPVPDPKSAAAEQKNSVSDKTVVTIRGNEVMETFEGGADMPNLRNAAKKWYDENLRNSTAMMKDGTVVHFNRRGRDKTTYGGQGDVHLRSVPAIAHIIEKGSVVLREPGTKDGVLERVVIAAPVNFMGKTVHLAVSIHVREDGQYHYDLTGDRDAGNPAQTAGNLKSVANASAGAPRITRGETDPSGSVSGSLDAAPDGFNIFYWEPKSNNSGKTAQIVAEITRGSTGSIVKSLLDNGKIQIVDTAENNVQGWVDSAGNVTLVSANIVPGAAHPVLMHELFHSGAKALVGRKVWNGIMRDLGAMYKQYANGSGKAQSFFEAAHARVAFAEDKAGRMSEELRIEEFGAYAIEEYENAPKSVSKWAQDAMGQVKAWLLTRFGTQIGKVSPAQLRALTIAALKSGSIGTDRAQYGATSKNSIAAVRDRITNLKERDVIDRVSGSLIDMQPHLLKAIPLNYFTELAQSNMISVPGYLKVKRMLDAYRGKKHAVADATAKAWMAYSKLGKDKVTALADLMHASTLAGIDPSSTLEEVSSQPAYAQLRKDYMALPQSGRDLFQRVRDDYKAQSEELDNILLDNVRKVFEIAQYKAEKDYTKELDRLQRVKMDPKARREAEDDALNAYKSAMTKARWSMKARMTKMRIAFESSRLEGVYFPLARFGRYFVTVKDVDGSVISFSRREKIYDRDKLAADMRKAYPHADVTVGLMEQARDIRDAMDPRMVAELQNIIGSAGIDANTASSVMDQIWQRYLTTMPDLSTRKKFIHRKGTAGFAEDALRAYSSHMFHAAHQMGRLKYGVELNELTNRTVEEAKDAKDPTKAMILANELKARHQWVMNPTGGKAAQVATTAAFVWYLAATPAAALVNLTQTPMMGIPILGGKFGSTTKATAALLKASADTFRGKGNVDHEGLAADEKRAIEAFYDSGLIDRTQSHDLAGVGETGVEYSPWRAKWMARISWMFHRAEVWNREVTALAAYRMARDAGYNESGAIDAAHDLTWKTHFDYSNSSRPRLMQNDFAKVALVFRSHNINMIYRITRDLHQAFKGENAQSRREARYQLAGVFGMMGLMGGVTGMFGFNAAMTILGMMFGDDDDPFDFEQKFKKDVVDILGPQLGGVVLHGAPGYYAGIDLTSRIGFADIWFRSPTRELQGKAEYDYWVMNSLGASLSMAGDWWSGLSSIVRDGDYQRGLEKLMPKAGRDLSKAYRYLSEGVVSARGDQVLDADAISYGDVALQAMGFTPAKVSETWDRNSALKNAEQRIKDQRKQLMNRYALAVTMKDPEARKKATEAIKRFNKVPMNRPLAITPDALRQSLNIRKRNTRKREDGVLISNPTLGKQLRKQLPDTVYR